MDKQVGPCRLNECKFQINEGTVLAGIEHLLDPRRHLAANQKRDDRSGF
jgi:hypothetical protein